MTEQKKRDTGTHSFTAEQDGRYSYCFSNEMSTVTGKTLRLVNPPARFAASALLVERTNPRPGHLITRRRREVSAMDSRKS